MPSREPIPGRCAIPLEKQPGWFCTQWPVKITNRGRCKQHGGAVGTGRPRGGIKQSILRSASFAERIEAHRQDPLLRDLTHQLATIRAAVDLSTELIEQALKQLQSSDAVIAATAGKNLLTALEMLNAQNAVFAGIAKREAEIALTDQAVKTGDLTLALTELPLAFADTLTAICDATGADLETARELVKQAWSERMSRANSPLLRAAALPPPKQ